MPRKPAIGINCHAKTGRDGLLYSLDHRYVRSVQKAGGRPILLPFFREKKEVELALSQIDGLLLTGGGDMHPKRWGERRTHPKSNLVPQEKESSDLLLAKEAFRKKVPTLAICLGAQVMNVATGGTIDQHIPDRKDILAAHKRSGTWHTVHPEKRSRIGEILGPGERNVNSYHHQAIKKTGRGLIVTSRTADGVIESVESAAGWFLLGVQWHPERMEDRRDQQRIFHALTAEAKTR